MKPSAPDGVLVAAAQAGSLPAVAMLYDRYFEPLARLLGARLRDHDAGLDLAQKAFLRAIPRLSQLRARDAFRPWLYTIGMRLLATELHRRQHPLRQTDQLEGIEHWPSSEVADQVDFTDRVATQDAVMQTLDRLSDNDRQVLFLRHVGGCSAREIAMITGITPDTAQRRVNRAEQRFRDHHRSFSDSSVAIQVAAHNGFGWIETK